MLSFNLEYGHAEHAERERRALRLAGESRLRKEGRRQRRAERQLDAGSG